MEEEFQSGMHCLVVDTHGSTPRKAGARMLVMEDGRCHGSVGGGAIEQQVIRLALEQMNTGEPFVHSFQLAAEYSMHCGGNMMVFFEPIGRGNHLYIIGAGHVGKATARLASQFGFKVHLMDERVGIFEQGVPSSIVCHTLPFSEAISAILPNQNSFVMVATPTHSTDEEITGRAASLPLAYLGMIGSQSKVAKAKIRFRDEFRLSEEVIAQIDMPIGIPLTVETPDEIALSIVARLVDRRNAARRKGFA